MDICRNNSSIIWCVESGTSNIFCLEGAIKAEQTTNPANTGMSNIISHPENSLRANISCTGFIPTSKVYTTNDGGKTWENISTGLPNLPINCIYYHRRSNYHIYVGLSVGLFYSDNESDGWVQMDEGLPHNEIPAIYPGNKLRVAVYGCDIWEYDTTIKVSATVLDMKGQKLYKKTISKDFQELDIRRLIPGYTLFG